MASEKRLIDANALVKDLELLAKHEDDFRQSVILGVAHTVRNHPTVDAVEVVHGRWENMRDGKYANPRYRCSVCKEKANYKYVKDHLLSWHDVQVLTPYCPYCLAKLDGGNEDGK